MPFKPVFPVEKIIKTSCSEMIKLSAKNPKQVLYKKLLNIKKSFRISRAGLSKFYVEKLPFSKF